MHIFECLRDNIKYRYLNRENLVVGLFEIRAFMDGH